MDHRFQEQSDKLQRYEIKLRDTINAYKKLQTEAESLKQRLATMELQEFQLLEELGQKTKAFEEQCAKNADMNGTINKLVLEKEEYQKEAGKITFLKRRVDQLLEELDVEKRNSKGLQDALSEAQEQHEASTLHYETRISEIISTLKTYQEIHQTDTETIGQLRSGKAAQQNKDVSQAMLSKATIDDIISTLVDCRKNESEASRVNDLFDFMCHIWRAIIEITPLQKSCLEKQLRHRLDLKSLVSIELVEACERERNDLQQELDVSKLRLMSLRDVAKTSPSLRSRAEKSPKESFPLDDGSEVADKHNVELQLQEAQSHIKILRKQNLTTLLELESMKKSMHSKLAAVEDEAAERLAEAVARQEGQLARIESEACRYREQMLSLLKEKEEEISELRTALLPIRCGSAAAPSGLPTAPLNNTSALGSEAEEVYSPNDLSASHCGLMHCAERHGRLMLEVRKLRNSKRELEQRVEVLESQIREERETALQVVRTANGTTADSLASSSSASTAMDVNLAYVKNIVFNLLSSFNTSSLSSRMTVLKALVMALRFSPEEESALIGGIIT